MRHALLVLALYCQLFGVLHVSRDTTPFSTHPYQITLEDAARIFNVEEVLAFEGSSTYLKADVSYTQNVFWTKVEFKNTDTTPLPLMLQNLRAPVGMIDVWVFKDGNEVASHKLGMFRDSSARAVRSTKSVFYLSLQPGEEATVVTRLESLGAMNLTWEVLSTGQYTLKNSLEMVFWGLFGGAVLALIIYNLTMFINLKERTHLFYVLHASCAWWFVYAMSGMLHFLGVLDGDKIFVSTWFVPFLMLFWLSLFSMEFFDLKTNDSLSYRIFSITAWASFGMFVVMSFGLFTQALLPYAHHVVAFGYMLILFMLVATVRLVFKQYEGAWYFLVGEGTYLLALTFTIVAISARIELTTSLLFVLPLGMLVEIVMFSMALSSKIGRMKVKHRHDTLLLLEESKFAAVGKNISEVVHQWKEPISSLASHVVYLEGLLRFGKEKEMHKGLEEGLPNMKKTLFYLKDSLDELYGFFAKTPHLEPFFPAKQIALALQIQRSRLLLQDVEVVVACSEKVSITNNQSALANVLMILLDNSLEAFAHRPNRKGRKITITTSLKSDHWHLCYEDNAGGIALVPPERIFDTGVSTKESGMGLGLSLAKKLVTERMNGALHVKSSRGATQFYLSVPV
ncbi:sensor histidine kinase [Sulfurospirillum sp. T05]|uniref:Sensor histidine kinase n=1 Tax=Sulfurospirillum tamanense TaxID=2813362 RepID=A0ABS2WPV2_9BACT|nr:sensor histidine kinase [Sulfurospirillum tamanensis]MBN2963540.1 sensor histidine kinase [Sulfurospirillum tamanensis]